MRTTLHAIVGIAAALALIGSPVGADTKPDAKVDSKVESKPAAANSPRSKLVTLDYVNAEVTDVIRSLASQSGINVALNPSVKGQITIHLRDKTVEEALTMVTNSTGLSAKKVGDTYVVAPRAEMKQALERLGTTRRVMVSNMTPKDAAEMAGNAFPDLTARPEGKAVALTGATEDLDAAERLINHNDSLTPDDTQTTEKYTLKNRPVAQAAASIGKMAPSVHVEIAGDSLVLSGPKTQVEVARHSLEMIDVKGLPDMDMRIYNIRYASAIQLVNFLAQAVPEVQVTTGPESYAPAKPQLNLISGQFVGFTASTTGDNTQQTSATALTGSPTAAVTTGTPQTQQVNVNKNALTLLLQGPPAAMDKALRALAMVDVPPTQMTIEARVVETTPEQIEDYGVKWNWTRFGFYEGPAGTHISGAPASGSDFTDFVTRPLGFGAFSRVPWSINAVLSAMITDKKATILASPHISVINDQDASIFIGDTLRFQSLVSQSATAGSAFTVVEVPVGIILLCHPRVSDDGNITLRVHPVVSTVGNFVNGLPQTAAREAETTVRVKDGDTLVIGGLIKDQDIREIQKVPLLADLPFIGKLFTHRLRDHSRSEVMVFLTIHLNK